MSAPETIIFDAEGVVVDTEGLWDQAQAMTLSQRGRKYNSSVVKHLITGLSSEKSMAVLMAEYQLSGSLQDLVAERECTMKDLLAGSVNFVPGFLSFLALVPAGSTCIATSMSPALLQEVDRRLGLSPMFGDRIYTVEGSSVPSKPAPDIFLHAAEQMNASPRQCVVIEDSPHGLSAARAAGMTSVGLATTHDRRLLDADYVCDSWSDVISVFAESDGDRCR